jgi:DNA helicase II / ATP-dependent DNA helicase PcrA
MNILNNLNTAQYDAVTLNNQHSLILAGAGSGKTRVLTTRIAWLLQQNMASAYSILAVTFTNKAAKEMQERLAAMVDFNIKPMFIGTFHSLCHRLLRLHAKEAGLNADFQILDTQDQQSLIKRILKQNSIDIEPKLIINFINVNKEKALRSHQIDITQDRFNGKLINLYYLYEQECQKDNLVDFAELLLRCDDLFTNNETIRQHYQNRFKYILIDEFQDTNTLQYQWLKRFKSIDNVFFAVGDDDQSIYSFRGARVKNMYDYQREFSVQKIIKLEQNYRSNTNILECANAIIKNNISRIGKNLFTEVGDGEKVKIYSANSDDLEVHWITKNIINLIDNGQKAIDIAVLYRSNAQSRLFEHVFFKEQIPYKVYGGVRFFERAEIKHALAYLQLIDNIGQNISFTRVVNFPARGIGEKTIQTLQEAAKNLDLSLADAYDNLPARSKASIYKFIELIDNIKNQAKDMNLADLIEFMLNQTGLMAHYKLDAKENEERINNLKELISAAHSFYTEENIPHSYAAFDNLDAINISNENIPPNTTALRLFLSYAMLESGGSDAENKNCIQLMTIHASKGLEFNNVFLTGLEEGLFPNTNNSTTEESIEEERRLMYVAITRARQNLHISCSQMRMLYGQTSFNRPSRFLDELPEDNIEWTSPKIKSRNYSSSSHSMSNYSKKYNSNDIFDSYSQIQHSDTYENQPPFSFAQKQKETRDDMAHSNALGQKIAANKANTHSLNIGVKVFSTKFGEGIVKAIEGSGENSLAKIKFNKHGDKVLNIMLANLQLLEENQP